MKESVVIQSRNTFQNSHLSFMYCKTLPPLYGHAAPGLGLRLFFFMVVGLVAQSNPQLLKIPHSLAVNVQPRLCGRSGYVVPEDIAHVVEQSGHCQQQFRTLPLLLPFQNILSIGMTIRMRHPEAVPRRFFVFGNAIASEVQLPQQIAGPGVILVNCIVEILRRFDCVLLHGLAHQVFLAQPVDGVSVLVLGRSLQPLDAIDSVTHLRIIREVQLAKGILSYGQIFFCRQF